MAMLIESSNIDASRMTGEEWRKDETFYWTCWNLPTSAVAPPIAICDSYKSLEDLGSGFPLYFQFKLYTALIYFQMMMLISIFGVTLNWMQDKGDEWNDGERPTIPVRMSIGNHGVSPDHYNNYDLQLFEAVNVIMIIFIIVSSIILRK